MKQKRPLGLFRQGRTHVRLWVPCLLVFVLCQTPALADDGWWGGLSQTENVPLDDVLANQRAYTGKTLAFTAIFHKMDQYYDPLRSGLNAQRYDNFAMWADGKALWENEQYLTTYPFFYLPKSHRQRDELMRLARFTRLQITARMRGNIRGKPAFEVISFRPTGHRLGERVVRQMMDGDKRARRGDIRVAARRYREVLVSHPDLPPVYELRIRKRLADALREMGYPDDAIRVEGGAPIEGATPLPKSRTDPFQPDTAPRGFDEPVVRRGDASGSPDDAMGRGIRGRGIRGRGIRGRRGDAGGSPDSGLQPACPDASGSPDGDLGAPPGFPAPSGAPFPAPGALPGQPTRDLPGTPAAPLGGFPAPDQRPPSDRGTPPPRERLPGLGDPGERAPTAQPEPAPQAPVRLPGVAPKRTPRMTGVK